MADDETLTRTEQMAALKAEIIMYLRDLCARDDLDAAEMLALLAYMTGAAIAQQDQRAITASEAMDIVAENIGLGNEDAVRTLLDAQAMGSA